MADPRTNLKVKIGGDLADIKSALASLRGDLAKTKKDAASTNMNGLTSSLKGLIGTVAGIGAVGLAIRGIFRATVEAEKAQAQLNAVIKSTGGAAGVTAKSANALADSLQRITTYDDEAILGAETLLLRFKNIGADVLPAATKAVLNMSTALGTDLDASVTKIGKALQDPISGMTSLQKVGVKLTDSQKALIKELVETGRVAEAQAIILKELERAYGGSAEAARDTLGGALEGLKNDFENLLEGDSGGDGVRGTIDAVNDLSEVLQSPQMKAGFTNIVNGLVSVIEFTAKATIKIADFGKRVAEVITQSTAGAAGDIPYIEKRLAALKKADAQLITFDFTGRNKREIAEYEKLLAEAKAYDTRQKIDFTNFNPPAAPGPKKAPEKTEAAVTEAKKTASAVSRVRVDAAKDTAAELERIQKQEADDIAERNERIAAGLADVNIELLRQTGQTAEAAFAEIDAKYAQLLADLQAKGDSEGEATLRKLIGLEKADVVLSAFKDKVSAAMEALRTETDFINAQQQIPGGMTATDAERAIQAARDKTLTQLRAIRTEAALAFNQKPTPETIAALKELDTTIAQVQQTQNDMANSVKDTAVNSLSTFFTDLATGAKNFKDAFKDMLSSFLTGVAQMIAQKLALKAVDAIAGGFGFHGGGLVGAGGGFRREVSASVFAGAPRFHSGGVAGLKPGEVPAILQTGERVLSRSETAKYSAGQRPSPGTRIVNVFDPSFVPDQMDSAAGEKVILNIIGRNPGRIQSMLR